MTRPGRGLWVLPFALVVALLSYPVDARMGGGGGGGHGGGSSHGGGPPPGSGGHGGWGGPHGGGGWHGGWGGHWHGGPSFVFGTGFGFYDPFFYPYRYGYPYPYPYAYPPYTYPYTYLPPYDVAAAPLPDASAPPQGPPPTADATPPESQGGSPYADTSTYGLVQLRDVPDGGAVDLDGRFWLEAHNLDRRWLAVPSGSHTIVVRVEGYAPVERTFDVGPGDRQVVRIGRLRADAR